MRWMASGSPTIASTLIRGLSERRRVLEDDTDVAARPVQLRRGGARASRRPSNRTAPRVGREEPEDEPRRRALPGARLPDERQRLPGGEVEGDAVDDGAAPPDASRPREPAAGVAGRPSRGPEPRGAARARLPRGARSPSRLLPSRRKQADPAVGPGRRPGRARPGSGRRRPGSGARTRQPGGPVTRLGDRPVDRREPRAAPAVRAPGRDARRARV